MAHTPGPWHTCRQAKCSCFTVMSDNHPIANVTHGSWGDDYPSIRLIGPSSLELKAEAYMEQITYGEISVEIARANWRLIAAAPDLLGELQRMVEHFGSWITDRDATAETHAALHCARTVIAKAIGVP